MKQKEKRKEKKEKEMIQRRLISRIVIMLKLAVGRGNQDLIKENSLRNGKDFNNQIVSCFWIY